MLTKPNKYSAPPALSDAGHGRAGPYPVNWPSESVAAVYLQQWLPAVVGGELEAGWCGATEPAHTPATPPQTTLHLWKQDGEETVFSI